MDSSYFNKSLFDRYYAKLFYFARRMVENEELAKDLVQDAFVRYLEYQFKILPHELVIKSFLYSTVKFAVFNLGRKRKIMEHFWKRTPYDETDDIDYEYAIIRTEFMGAIYGVIDSLPTECRRIMTLSYVDGLSNDAIAQQLVISINTVKTQKKRGLKILRTRIRPEYV